MSITEGEKWAQTLISITPEDDAVLREISTTAEVSADGDTPLDLSPESVAYRRPLTYKHMLNDYDFEDSMKDAQNQTYIQGVPVIDIVLTTKDAAMQTMYMRALCSSFKEQRDIMTSMNDEPMPTLKVTRYVQTVVSIDPNAQLHQAVESLTKTLDGFKFPGINERDEAEAEASGILQLIINRSLWIAQPLAGARPGDQENLEDKETETYLKFNGWTGLIMIDSETQTGLTCGPKESNTALLSDYQEKKNLAKEILNECLDNGVIPRLVVTEVIDEIVDQCAARIRYPLEDRETQTVASYRTSLLRDDDLLRKLKRSVIVDPLESSIVVVVLMNDLLQEVCSCVMENAQSVAKDIILSTVHRAALIGIKLAEIRKSAEPKSMDLVFEQRRKKIIESVLKKETETASMQTDIGGVRELTKIKELKDKLCTVCPRPSFCGPCCNPAEYNNMANQIDSTTDTQWKVEPTLRTQDILLAYKPCYVMMAESRRHLNSAIQPTRSSSPPPPTRALCSHRVTCNFNEADDSHDTIDVLLKPRKSSATRADSITGWSHVIEASLTKPWSIRGSRSTMSRATLDCRGKSTSRSTNSTLPKTRSSGLVPQTVQALQVLKNTFCPRQCRARVEVKKTTQPRKDNGASKTVCPVCVTCDKKQCEENIRRGKTGDDTSFDKPDCFEENVPASPRTRSSMLKQKNRSMNLCQKSHAGKLQDEYLKLIPIQCLSDSDS